MSSGVGPAGGGGGGAGAACTGADAGGSGALASAEGRMDSGRSAGGEEEGGAEAPADGVVATVPERTSRWARCCSSERKSASEKRVDESVPESAAEDELPVEGTGAAEKPGRGSVAAVATGAL